MEKQNKEQKNPNFWGKYCVAIILTILVILAILVFLLKLNNSNTFSSGMEIGDIPLEGLTKDQLRQLLTQRTLDMKNSDLIFGYNDKQYKSNFSENIVNIVII